MSTSLSASQLHTVNMRDPLNRVLGENNLSACYREMKQRLPKTFILLAKYTRDKSKVFCPLSRYSSLSSEAQVLRDHRTKILFKCNFNESHQTCFLITILIS